MTPIRPPNPEFPDDAALLRYVSGQSPLAEAEAIRAWIAADPDRQASVDELRAAWSAPASAPAWDGGDVWARLRAEASPAAPPAAPEVPTRPIAPRFAPRTAPAPSRWTTVVARAAAILVVVGAGAGVLAHLERAAPVETRELRTSHGQRSVLNLADGTRVTLDANSRLYVPSDLGVAANRLAFWRAPRPRRLRLVGRAYFEVVHDESRPFIVDTRTASTEDIGTAFMITAYAEDTLTQVAVVEGSVALRDDPQSTTPESRTRATEPRPPLMVLTPGDVATLDHRGSATRTRGVALAAYTSWTKGVLTFDRTPMRDVIMELNRWYDIDVRVADSVLASRRLTAEIRTETADEALARIALVLGASVERDGRSIVLTSNRTSARTAR